MCVPGSSGAGEGTQSALPPKAPKVSSEAGKITIQPIFHSTPAENAEGLCN